MSPYIYIFTQQKILTNLIPMHFTPKQMIFLFLSASIVLPSCSEENIADSEGTMSKILSLTQSDPLFKVSYTTTVLTMINPIGPTTPLIEKMVERPIETKDQIKLTAWSGNNYKLETERLEADMSSFSVFEGLPNPDPIGVKTIWKNNALKVYAQSGVLLKDEYQEQPDISSTINEVTDFIDNFTADEISYLSGIPSNLQIGDVAEWQQYIDDPQANISTQPNGLSSIHVDMSDEDGMSNIAAIIVFQEIDNFKRFDAVQLYNQVSGKPISSTIYKYGEAINDVIPIIGYENRTIIDIGDNIDAELVSVATFENFELTIKF